MNFHNDLRQYQNERENFYATHRKVGEVYGGRDLRGRPIYVPVWRRVYPELDEGDE